MADAAPPEPDKDEGSLETTDDTIDALEGGNTDPNVTDATEGKKAPEAPKKGLKQKLSKFNLYLVLFIFILVVGGVIVGVAYFQSKKASTTATIKTQTLNESALQQVASSDATIGSTGQILNVQSSAVFAGKVLIRNDLEIAGGLQIGGTVALSDLTVSGTAGFGQVSIGNDLSVTGNSAIQGAETIGKSLQVNGPGTFSGPVSAPQLTTSSFSLNSDLILTHHIVAGGGTPGRTSGPALGSGGTATVGGSDTSGNVSINTGSNPAAGCFITVNFTARYSSTPHVLLTPIGSAAGGLAYYVNRDSSSFSICDSITPPAGSSFGFDYFVID